MGGERRDEDLINHSRVPSSGFLVEPFLSSSFLFLLSLLSFCLSSSS